jgi:two-component system alkaline phosphatase synthesis response regulator PhoP
MIPMPARPLKILIIDDEAGFTHLVKTLLERTGNYEVSEENEGTAALDKARAFKPDLILLDIQMPTTHGAYVALCLRGESDLQDTPIVYLTGIVPRINTTTGRELGGLPYLAKPVGLQELVDCINTNIPAEKRMG